MAEPEPPYDRLGVYKQLSEVPDRRLLKQFETSYEGRDTWAEYRTTVELSDRMGEEWARFERRWKSHMNDSNRHHALATPGDVEDWSRTLLDRFSIDRSYQHWNVIEGFYDWLKWHTEHPHTYNPFHIAATMPQSNTNQIWQQKMEKRSD